MLTVPFLLTFALQKHWSKAVKESNASKKKPNQNPNSRPDPSSKPNLNPSTQLLEGGEESKENVLVIKEQSREVMYKVSRR